MPTDIELRAAAAGALAVVPLEFHGSRKIRAIKELRDATGLGIKECIPLIDWAMEQGELPDRLALALRQAFTVDELRRMLADIGDAHGWTNEDGDAWDRFETALNQAQKEI